MNEEHPRKILILNDESKSTAVVLAALAERGIRGTVARDMAFARGQLDRRWDLVLTDASPWGEDALGFVRHSRREHPGLPVVMMGADATAAAARRAFREGCQDYLVKPLRAADVAGVLDELVPSHPVAWACSSLCPAEGNGRGGPSRWGIAGTSQRLLDVVRLARRVADTSVGVLITGESGTGKELIARLIHRESPRASGPYVRVNCASLSETLLESELFGHEQGAFTGAARRREGRFERAHRGTLLLDEISETSPRLQAELLRVLEERELERLGGVESVPVDVRVLCTSNRDLSAEIEAGRFRRDLYYRISGVHVKVPPLRERREDLPAVVWHFVNEYAGEVRRTVERLDPRMLETFEQHTWPGNVRELRNLGRAALILGEGPTLRLHPSQVLGAAAAPAAISHGSLRLRELERQAIFEALRRTESHQAKAAGLLGITDRTLREKLRRYRQTEKPAAAGEKQWITEPA